MATEAISHAEYYLSLGAVFPFLGSVPAAIKIGMGCIQTISGLALAIIFVIPACFSETGKEIFRIGVVHIVHGGGNVLVGILEAIPIVGTVIALKGLEKTHIYWSNAVHVNPGVILTKNPQGEYIKQTPLDTENYYRARLIIDEPCGKFLVYRDLVEEHGTMMLEQRNGEATVKSEVLNYDEAKAAKLSFDEIAPYWIAV